MSIRNQRITVALAASVVLLASPIHAQDTTPGSGDIGDLAPLDASRQRRFDTATRDDAMAIEAAESLLAETEQALEEEARFEELGGLQVERRPASTRSAVLGEPRLSASVLRARSPAEESGLHGPGRWDPPLLFPPVRGRSGPARRGGCGFWTTGARLL